MRLRQITQAIQSGGLAKLNSPSTSLQCTIKGKAGYLKIGLVKQKCQTDHN